MDPDGECIFEGVQSLLLRCLAWYLTGSLGNYVILECATDYFLKHAYLLLVIFFLFLIRNPNVFRSGYFFKVMKNLAIVIA